MYEGHALDFKLLFLSLKLALPSADICSRTLDRYLAFSRKPDPAVQHLAIKWRSSDILDIKILVTNQLVRKSYAFHKQYMSCW